MSAVPRPRGNQAERGIGIALGVAMSIAAVTIAYLGRDLIFFSDELGWLTFGHDFSPSVLLTPHNGHLIAVPRAIYEVLPTVFGAHYLPFRIVALAAFLACVALFFVIMRRHIGSLALAPSIVLLFFGSAAVIVISPLAIPFTFSIAFGLATVLALDSNRPSGGVLAAALLTLSLLSHSFGGIIAAGVAIFLLLGDEGRRQLWVPLVPIGLYAAWWVWALKFDQGLASTSNIPEIPAFVAESTSATLAAITGFAGPTIGDRFGAWADGAEVLALSGTALAGLSVAWRQRGEPASRWLLPFLVILLGFWMALGLSEAPGREPTTPRYLFFGSIMLMLVVAARARGASLGVPVVVAVIAASGLSLALNLSRLVTVAEASRENAVEVRAQLGALEIAGDAAVPSFIARNAGSPASKDIPQMAGAYLAFVEESGALGSSPAELAKQPEVVRIGVDFVLARVENLQAIPRPASAPVREVCLIGRPTVVPPGVGGVELHPGSETLFRLADAGPPQPLLLGRFASPTVAVGPVGSDSFVALDLPLDNFDGPWRVEAAAPIEICSAR